MTKQNKTKTLKPISLINTKIIKKCFSGWIQVMLKKKRNGAINQYLTLSGFLNIRAELRRRQWKIRHPTIGKAGFRTPVGVHPRRRKWPAWAYTIMSVLFEKFFLFLAMLSPCGIIVPRPGIEPHPLHWGQRVLTTGPPGKAWESFFFFFFNGFVLCRMLFPFMSPFIHSSIQWSR